MIDIRPVVLSGGSGTRLWPLSQKSRPKQFLQLDNSDTLFRKSLLRLLAVPNASRPLIVTAADYLDLTLAGLGGIDAQVILEPRGRNTAPAVVAAALMADLDDVLVVAPSDHLVSDDSAFVDAVTTAVSIAGEGGIVTLGVEPERADTGFGYIERGEALSAGHTIASFVEKPDVARAEVMVESGRYLWNAGLFVGRAGVILDEASRQRPDLVAAVEASLPDEQTDVVTLKEDFLDVVPEPFDKAVMESTQIGVVIPLRAGWSDVGSWQSVWQAAIKDTEGNSVIGAVVVADSRNSYVSGSSRPVVVIGVEGVAVVETEDGILVMSLDRSHDLRSIVERLPDQHGDTSG